MTHPQKLWCTSPWAVLLLWFCQYSSLAGAGEEQPVDFARQIQPLLQQHCLECHGADEQSSHLRLDQRLSLLRGGDQGLPAIVPGQPEESYLLDVVSGRDAAVKMPPEGPALNEHEIELLRQWIKEGAAWPGQMSASQEKLTSDHWSLQKVARPEVPRSEHHWGTHPIDAFLLRELLSKNLQPSLPADRATLIRRVTLDLTGLPPTFEEVKAFLNDPAETAVAYERIVDRLLSSPRYGERWAQHWLDVIRYADTRGYEYNSVREHAWPYRDYVIEAFNQDKAWDRFIVEQIAGDTLGIDPATGFLVTAPHPTPQEVGQEPVQIKQARYNSLDEILQNVGTSMLGLTIGCARCHNHKFDPITAEDYYGLLACFEGVDYADREWRKPVDEDQLQRIHEAELRLQELEGRLAEFTVLTERSAEPVTKQTSPETVPSAPPNPLQAERDLLDKRLQELKKKPKVFAAQFRQPGPTHFFHRGDPQQPRHAVAPGSLAVIDGLHLASETVEQERRLALANWIACGDNPLTARVAVNRIWHHHFGIGLVATPGDFGKQGAPPTHPELLDWLASEFVESGWSVKYMHHLIVTSAAYQQSNQMNPEGMRTDPQSLLLWRFPPRRLEAEAIRDSVLFVAGHLNVAMGGPGYSVFQNKPDFGEWQPLSKLDPQTWRRTIYMQKMRAADDGMFKVFDVPDCGQVRAMRVNSTTPLQALNLFNGEFIHEQARGLADRVVADCGAGASPDQLAERLVWIVLSRPATASEREAIAHVIQSDSLHTAARVLLNTNEFLFLP